MPFLRRLHRANKLKLSKSERKGERRKDGHMGVAPWAPRGGLAAPMGPSIGVFLKKI
jgi:hypothetical protein